MSLRIPLFEGHYKLSHPCDIIPPSIRTCPDGYFTSNIVSDGISVLNRLKSLILVCHDYIITLSYSSHYTKKSLRCRKTQSAETRVFVGKVSWHFYIYSLVEPYNQIVLVGLFRHSYSTFFLDHSGTASL